MRDDLTSNRKGAIGELIVAIDLMEKRYDIFKPYCDDISGIDLVSYKDGWYDSLQVRYHTTTQVLSSIFFNVNPCQADTIAIPIANKVCYVPNRRKGERWHINLNFGHAKNKQKKRINNYYDFLEYKPRRNK